MVPRRAALVTVAFAAAVFAATSGAGAAQRVWPQLSVPLSTSSSMSFSYPARWHVLGSTLSSRFVTSHYALLAFVGTVPMHKPCLEAPSPCNPEAIDSLPLGHVYARWSAVDSAPSAGHATATPVTIGGRHGWMLVDPRGWCRRYGAARTVLVYLSPAVASGALRFDACLRPPGLKAEQATVLRILRSTKFSTVH